MAIESQRAHPHLRVASAITPMPVDGRRSDISTVSIVVALIGLALAITNYLW